MSAQAAVAARPDDIPSALDSDLTPVNVVRGASEPDSDGETGKLSAQTLDRLLTRAANARPDARAVSDPPNVRDLIGRQEVRYPFAEAEAVVTRLAQGFQALNLAPGSVVALQLPNVAEAPLILLAVLRAGLVASPMPLLWRRTELVHAFSIVKPSVAIGCGLLHDHDYANEMRLVAAEVLSVRFLYGIGEKLADGVAPVTQLMVPGGTYDEGLPQAEPDARSASAPALITWRTDRGPNARPVVHSHAQLVATGLMHCLEVGLKPKDRVLNAMPLTSYGAVGSVLAPWLIAGAGLVQHHPFDLASFVEQAAWDGVSYTVLPSVAIDALSEQETLLNLASLRRLGCLHTGDARIDANSHRDITRRAEALNIALYDIWDLGGRAQLIRKHQAGEPDLSVPLGKISSPSWRSDGIVLLETRARATVSEGAEAIGGELLVRGPVVGRSTGRVRRPDRGSVSQGFEATGLRCRINGSDHRFCVLEPDPDKARRGGLSISLAELDTLYADYPGFTDAYAVPLPDPVLGHRIGAAALASGRREITVSELKAYLSKRDVAPYKLPESLVIVEHLPRDAAGRPQRQALLELFPNVG